MIKNLYKKIIYSIVIFPFKLKYFLQSLYPIKDEFDLRLSLDIEYYGRLSEKDRINYLKQLRNRRKKIHYKDNKKLL